MTKTTSATILLGTASCLAILHTVPAQAKVVGMNQPAESVTATRIAALPPSQRGVWTAYLARSQAAMRTDKARLAAERKPGMAIPPAPGTGNGVLTMPLDRPADWYAGAEARRIADTIVSFQTPAGGWGKNQPRGAVRLPGQAYVSNNSNAAARPGDFDPSLSWHYVGTIDNDATTHEIRFLAKVATGLGRGAAAAPYRTSAARGVRYLLDAQYPNGGWPQVWPLEGGYHDAITLNDNAMAQVLDLLTDVAGGQGDFAVMPDAIRSQARAAAARGVDCILAMQVVRDGRRMGWGQQHDALTLAITSARNYEPAALAAPESAAVLRYLMGLPRRNAAVETAISAAADWLRASAIHGQAWRDANDGLGRRLIADPAAPLLWARFYTVDRNQPLFGDRDKTLHDDYMELSTGRRRGYAWFGTGPGAVLAAYDARAGRR